MNGYELSRTWFNFCFENPEKIKPNHSALYFFSIEHCNRLGWKEKFGFPTEMTKDAIGIKNYKTYINTLNDLVGWGFIKMIERSKNQYSSNIIALVNYTKATTKALDKASIKHSTKQVQSTYQSIDSIIKQITSKQLTIEQLTKEQILILKKFLKIKENKIKKSDDKRDVVFPFNSNEFIKRWNLWKEYKKTEMNHTYKPIGEQSALTKLSKMANGDEKTAIAIINQSLENGWKGLFDLKKGATENNADYDNFKKNLFK